MSLPLPAVIRSLSPRPSTVSLPLPLEIELGPSLPVILSPTAPPNAFSTSALTSSRSFASPSLTPEPIDSVTGVLRDESLTVSMSGPPAIRSEPGPPSRLSLPLPPSRLSFSV